MKAQMSQSVKCWCELEIFKKKSDHQSTGQEIYYLQMLDVESPPLHCKYSNWCRLNSQAPLEKERKKLYCVEEKCIHKGARRVKNNPHRDR